MPSPLETSLSASAPTNSSTRSPNSRSNAKPALGLRHATDCPPVIGRIGHPYLAIPRHSALSASSVRVRQSGSHTEISMHFVSFRLRTSAASGASAPLWDPRRTTGEPDDLNPPCRKLMLIKESPIGLKFPP